MSPVIAAVLEALTSDSNLEALPAQIDDAITYEADRINPPPPRP
jgi:hypothetical protein